MDAAASEPRTPRRAPRAAFTLIELLVVVAIIAMLVAILLPSLAGAKQQAMKTRCATNLAGLSKAMQTYLSEFDNQYPVNGILMPKPFCPSRYIGTNLQKYCITGKPNTCTQAHSQKSILPNGELWRYMNGVAKNYLCPLDTGERLSARDKVGTAIVIGNDPLTLDDAGTTVRVGPQSKGGYWSYSVNTVLNSMGRFRNNFTGGLPWVDPLKHTSIQNPVNFLVFIEEDISSSFNDEVFEPPAYRSSSSDSFLTGRHKGFGNVSYADGHVEPGGFNEILFNQVPSGASGTGTLDHKTAMQSPYTRMFFPDAGEFAATMTP